MENWRYFKNQDELDVKLGEMIRERRKLKERRVVLEREWRQHVKSWNKMGQIEPQTIFCKRSTSRQFTIRFTCWSGQLSGYVR